MNETRDPRKCAAHTRSGAPCEKFFMTGQSVCGTHGGRSPQAMAKAQRMVELVELRLRGLAGPAVATLEHLVSHADSESVRLQAAWEVTDRALGKAVERVQVVAAITVKRPW